VNPGFGGQGYLPAATSKIARVRELLGRRGSAAVLEVDGGITVETIGEAHRAGAEAFVAGTAVFGQDDVGSAVRSLREACAVRV
jgi:ribulose-phosphate 3-epimerase